MSKMLIGIFYDVKIKFTFSELLIIFVINMKIHLIKKLSILLFMETYSNSKSPFLNWLSILKFADWNFPNDIFSTFGSADLLGNGTDRVVFDIGGNNYRMICNYVFGKKEVHLFICWIGTHAEYDKLCKVNKQYEINMY